ncbi:MAG: hypothetical protein AMXMBFR83_10230 [Phycisphaerae bacterium]
MQSASAVSCLMLVSCAASPTHSVDVAVYGGTASGVVAAVQAARMGKTTAIIEPTGHLGGMTTGGLGATDIGNKDAIGGIARAFYRSVGKHYGQDESWTFEPHVAEAVINDMAREAGAIVLLDRRLKRVRMNGRRIVSLATDAGETIAAKVFIDASYEGDLMAAAGVSYTVGREGNARYGETLNGVQLGQKTHQFEVAVDPYVRPGDPSSGLLPRIQPGGPGEHGQADHRVQAYCFRMCLTQRPDIRVPFPKPDDYDPAQYELLARYLQAAEAAGRNVALMHHRMMPNGKTDTNNNGGFSTDNIGMNYDYPDGDWETRRRIIREHESYQKGLMWCLANDPRIPERVRKEVGAWGLCKDEFIDNGHWPHQLYIREARRMVSDLVMTEHHCRYAQVVDDPVGLGAYNMDSHNCQRYAREGRALNEGDVQVGVAAPYGISYRSIVPQRGQCANLLVPVCVSASHIAYGSVRMEPVFMILGQSAATAGVLAIDGGLAVQDVPYAGLRERLLADGQVLVWSGPLRRPAAGVKPSPGMVDDAEAKLTGAWERSASIGGFIGEGYLHDNNADKGAKSVRFPLNVERGGAYRVCLLNVPHGNRATQVPVTIRHADGETTVTVNQRTGRSIELGRFRFDAGREAWIDISNRRTEGHVIADAVQLIPVE